MPVKILLLGKERSGKTCLWKILTSDTYTYDENQPPTIGACFEEKNMKIGEESFNLSYWDVSGSSLYKQHAPVYYNSSDILLYCCDLNAKKDDAFYLEMNNTLHKFKKMASPKAFIILIGTKTDLFDNPDEAQKELIKVKQHLDKDIVINKTLLTSAKDNSNIDKVKNEIESILEQKVPKYLLSSIYNQLRDGEYTLHGGGVKINGKKYPASAARLIKELAKVDLDSVTDQTAISQLQEIQMELENKTKSIRRGCGLFYFLGDRDKTTAQIYQNIVSQIDASLKSPSSQISPM